MTSYNRNKHNKILPGITDWGLISSDMNKKVN